MRRSFNKNDFLSKKILRALLVAFIFVLIFQINTLRIDSKESCVAIRKADGKMVQLCGSGTITDPNKIVAVILPPQTSITFCEANSQKCITISQTSMNVNIQRSYTYYTVKK